MTKKRVEEKRGKSQEEESPDEEEVIDDDYSHETFDRDMVASAAEERRDEWFILT